MELMRRFDGETFERGLSDWRWLLDGRSFEPIAASIFGDVFLQGPDGIWFLDSLEGTVALTWRDEEAWQNTMDTEEGRDRFLLGGLAIGAYRRGIEPGPEQVFMFSTPPALGGELSSDNVVAMDFVVAASISAQLAAQLKDLPPGTPVSGFTVEGERPDAGGDGSR